MIRRAGGSLMLAIALSLIALLLLDLMGLVVKYLLPRYSAVELSAYRNIFGILPSLLVLLATPEWHRAGRRLRVRSWPLACLRGLYVTVAQLLFYYSLGKLEYATAATIAMTMSLFMTALSVPMLGHRVGPVRWAAVLLGFAGVVLIMNPGGDSFSLAALLPLGAAVCYALSSVTVQMIDTDAPSPLLNLYATLTAMVASTLFCLASVGFSPIANGADLAWVAAIGLFGGSGVLLLVIAFRMTDPSNLAPFNYFSILFAFVLGWVFFDETPFRSLFPGGLLIVISGLVIIWRERRLSRLSAIGSE